MRLDSVKSFITGLFKENQIYFTLIAPALMMLIAMVANLGVLCYLFIMMWFCGGLIIVFLPSTPETDSR